MSLWTRCQSNPRLPITGTNTTSIIKQAMTNATLLRTQVTPNDCGFRRGSGCSLRAPCSNSRLRRWLSRCLCQMGRGRWPDPLPPSYSLGWWHLCFTAGCRESRSRTERSADEVMDKALKQPTTPTKHAQTQTSIIKQAMTHTTILLT
jgi:hypothetical protein